MDLKSSPNAEEIPRGRELLFDAQVELEATHDVIGRDLPSPSFHSISMQLQICASSSSQLAAKAHWKKHRKCQKSTTAAWYLCNVFGCTLAVRKDPRPRRV